MLRLVVVLLLGSSGLLLLPPLPSTATATATTTATTTTTITTTTTTTTTTTPTLLLLGRLPCCCCCCCCCCCLQIFRLLYDQRAQTVGFERQLEKHLTRDSQLVSVPNPGAQPRALSGKMQHAKSTEDHILQDLAFLVACSGSAEA